MQEGREGGREEGSTTKSILDTRNVRRRRASASTSSLLTRKREEAVGRSVHLAVRGLLVMGSRNHSHLTSQQSAARMYLQRLVGSLYAHLVNIIHSQLTLFIACFH